MKRTLESGEEPGPPETTAEERIAMVWALTLEAWSLAGELQPVPPRHALPVRRTTLAAADP